ncbi:ABC transporter permease [Tissierella sp. P1]|uniref:ABC transporter permease n=2 Tax=Tissierella TaxID=41273 RepID=UPI0019123AA5|nr:MULTISPECIES: ABC transporter permease [Tissierella]
MGIVAARKEGSIIDVIFSGFSYILNSMPSFWLGLMLIIIFSSVLKLLPTYGMTDPRASYTGMAYVMDVMKHMILPVGTLLLVEIPLYFRIAKSSILQVTNEDFILTLRATGMSEKKIFNKYIFRNAILPTITIFGISMAYLITGVALIETVFAWPGTGRLVLTAITQRDYPTLMGIYLVMSISVAVVMMIVDIVYAVFDPRIRY